MDTEHYKLKVLFRLTEAPDGALKRSILTRAALNHIPSQECEMLLNFMEQSGLITMKIIRPIKGPGSPPTYIKITDLGKKTFKEMEKERGLG